jgi:hypothetical protein
MANLDIPSRYFPFFGETRADRLQNLSTYRVREGRSVFSYSAQRDGLYLLYTLTDNRKNGAGCWMSLREVKGRQDTINCVVREMDVMQGLEELRVCSTDRGMKRTRSLELRNIL